MHRALVAVVVALLAALALPAAPVAAASSAKVVIVVGPSATTTPTTRPTPSEIATEARRWTPNVVKLTTPNATWSRVKAAMQGANVFVYLGHGNGWPSPYAPFQTRHEGRPGPRSLDRRRRHEGRLLRRGLPAERHPARAQRRRPAVPPVLRLGQHGARARSRDVRGLARAGRQLRRRVHRRGRPGGLRRGPPGAPGRELRPAAVHDQPDDGPDLPRRPDVARPPPGSLRLPADARARLRARPRQGAPSGFYRSVIGDLSLTASKVVGTPPARTDTHPGRLRRAGRRRGRSRPGRGCSRPRRPPPTRRDPRVHARRSHAPAADGARPSLRRRHADPRGHRDRHVDRRASCGPRRSCRATARTSTVWTLDQSASLLSPNGDGTTTSFVVAARFSEPAATTFVSRTPRARSSRPQSVTATSSGSPGTSRSPRARSPRRRVHMDASRRRTRGATGRRSGPARSPIDATAPVTKATSDGDRGCGPAGSSSPRRRSRSGHRRDVRRDVHGPVAPRRRRRRRLRAPVQVTANGSHTFEYRAVDKAGIREAWKSLAFKIDTQRPDDRRPLTRPGRRRRRHVARAVVVKPVGQGRRAPASRRSRQRRRRRRGRAGDGPGRRRRATAPTRSSLREGRRRQRRHRPSSTFTIDTVAPTVALPEPPASPPTVTPNGDPTGEQVTLPFSSRSRVDDGRRSRRVRRPDVQDERGPAVTAAASLERPDGAGKALPDGRYAVSLTPTDAAGNAGDPGTAGGRRLRRPRAARPHPGAVLPAGRRHPGPSTKASLTMRAPGHRLDRRPDASGAVVRTGIRRRRCPPAPPRGLERQARRRDLRPARPLPDRRPGDQRRAARRASPCGARGRVQLTTSIADGRPRQVADDHRAGRPRPCPRRRWLVIYEPGLPYRTVTMTRVELDDLDREADAQDIRPAPGTLSLKVGRRTRSAGRTRAPSSCRSSSRARRRSRGGLRHLATA